MFIKSALVVASLISGSLAAVTSFTLPNPPISPIGALSSDTTFDTTLASGNGIPFAVTSSSSLSSVTTSTFNGTTFCPTSRHRTSRHHSSRSHCTSSACTSKSHCTKTSCHTKSHHHHHKPCCWTKTKCTTISKTKCYILEKPCTVTKGKVICTTVTALPTSTHAVCTPCTKYVTVTKQPSLVCTTMVFCDVANQSENCKAENNHKIESIVSGALRNGGQVYVNGQLVVFGKSGSASSAAANGSAAISVTGQEANDASAISAQGIVMSFFGLMAGAAFLI